MRRVTNDDHNMIFRNVRLRNLFVYLLVYLFRALDYFIGEVVRSVVGEKTVIPKVNKSS